MLWFSFSFGKVLQTALFYSVSVETDLLSIRPFLQLSSEEAFVTGVLIDLLNRLGRVYHMPLLSSAAVLLESSGDGWYLGKEIKRGNIVSRMCRTLRISLSLTPLFGSFSILMYNPMFTYGTGPICGLFVRTNDPHLGVFWRKDGFLPARPPETAAPKPSKRPWPQ